MENYLLFNEIWQTHIINQKKDFKKAKKPLINHLSLQENTILVATEYYELILPYFYREVYFEIQSPKDQFSKEKEQVSQSWNYRTSNTPTTSTREPYCPNPYIFKSKENLFSLEVHDLNLNILDLIKILSKENFHIPKIGEKDRLYHKKILTQIKSIYVHHNYHQNGEIAYSKLLILKVFSLKDWDP